MINFREIQEVSRQNFSRREGLTSKTKREINECLMTLIKVRVSSRNLMKTNVCYGTTKPHPKPVVVIKENLFSEWITGKNEFDKDRNLLLESAPKGDCLPRSFSLSIRVLTL